MNLIEFSAVKFKQIFRDFEVVELKIILGIKSFNSKYKSSPKYFTSNGKSMFF